MPLRVEDVSARELAEITEMSTSVDVGKVFFRGPLEAMYTVNCSARTINRLYLLLAREEFISLSDIYRVAKSIDRTSVLTCDMSFAVRCERIGKHYFISINVARVVDRL
jgi:23S rRNA G2445 N2-methylase RlmL